MISRPSADDLGSLQVIFKSDDVGDFECSAIPRGGCYNIPG
jgi:hypothetical protein